MKTLRYIILILTAILFSISASAQNELIQKADIAYAKREYAKAAELYSQAIDATGRNSDLYYNLGNCYYRTGKLGQAIVCYEKALQLNPRNHEARANLQFVNSRITDQPGERGTLIGEAINSILDMAKANVWAWIAFGFFVLTVGAVSLYCFTSNIMARKAGFFGGIVLFVITCFTIFLSFKAAARTLDHNVAIVIAKASVLSTKPSTPHSEADMVTTLHEGTKAAILDSVMSTTDSIPGMWIEVEVDNSTRGWLRASDSERL